MTHPREDFFTLNTVSATAVPLVVDLDGSLIKTDLLHESAAALLAKNPLTIFKCLKAWLRGKAALKESIAAAIPIDVSALPYNNEVIAEIQAARAAGRPVYLASASDESYVKAVATHLGLFDGHFASNGLVNLSGTNKAKALTEAFGNKGFDYIGNAQADLAIWVVAARCIAVGPSAALRRQLGTISDNVKIIPTDKPTIKTWLKLFRVHQYAKNALVFVPLLTSQSFNVHAIASALLAVASFSLCASAVYILNDLVDLPFDRRHPRKRYRPFAAGTVPVIYGVLIFPFLLGAAFALSAVVSVYFLAVLIGYFALTTAYSFVLKRKLLVDVVVLASLYTVRMIGGAVAINVVVSEWLLAFSMFMFFSLALMKRYTELTSLLDAGLPDPSNRNYKVTDLSTVGALAAAAGFNAVTVFALYISSETVHKLYHHPQFLWLICPILLYWIGRALMLAQRRLLNDDPIIFALKDWNSLLAGFLIGAIMLCAI